MDLEAILLSLAERERWIRRKEALTEDLERLRRRRRSLDKTRRRLQKEKARLLNLASSLEPAVSGSPWEGQRSTNERGKSLYPLR